LLKMWFYCLVVSIISPKIKNKQFKRLKCKDGHVIPSVFGYMVCNCNFLP